MSAILDKVQKLLALAGNNPSEGEAASAREKAMAMLAEHGLTMGDVETHTSSTARKVENVGAGVMAEEKASRLQRWATTTAHTAAKVAFCEYFFSRWSKRNPCGSKTWYKIQHNFVGRESNVAAAADLARYLLDTVERLAKDAAKSVDPKSRARFERDFRDGCATRLYWRAVEMRKQADAGKSTSNLPALLNLSVQLRDEAKQYMAERMGIGKLKDAKTRQPRRGEGYARGDDAGRSIDLGGGRTRIG